MIYIAAYVINLLGYTGTQRNLKYKGLIIFTIYFFSN